MIIYRPHRGGLMDALQEAKTFNSVDEMIKYIKENDTLNVIQYLAENKNKTMPEEIREKEICIDDRVYYDERCGWNTQYVLCYGNCIGMCDLNWEHTEKWI